MTTRGTVPERPAHTSRPGGPPSATALAGALAFCLLLAGCTEATDSLHDLGRIRATFYRHELPVEPGRIAMPGDRLAPAAACGKQGSSDGLFDPCRPDPDQPELDEYGQPRIRPPAPAVQPQIPPTRPRTTRGAVRMDAKPAVPSRSTATAHSAKASGKSSGAKAPVRAGGPVEAVKPTPKPAPAKKPRKSKPKPTPR